MEILLRELLRLISALISAILSQSWKPLEGALGETGAEDLLWLFIFAGAALLALMLIAGLAAVALYLRRRAKAKSAGRHDGETSGQAA